MILLAYLLLFNSFQSPTDVISNGRERTLKAGIAALDSLPITITQYTSIRSAGSMNDFYSEGDYWWPNPENPDGSYIRRDGDSNPDNFVAHRLVLMRFAELAGALGAAYKYSGDEKYARALIKHLNAWFVDDDTKMNPHMLYAQAIKAKVTGRGIGIIDTIHLMEIILAAKAIQNSQIWQERDKQAVLDWFDSYLVWLTTHPFGDKEKFNGNNHSSTFALQVVGLAMITENQPVLKTYTDFFKTYLLPLQMDEHGGFPKELSRTKPYAYSIFNLDAMCAIAQLLKMSGQDDLFDFSLDDGRSLMKGVDFLYPYLLNKSLWPYQQDIKYWSMLPWQSPALLFSGLSSGRQELLECWSSLETESDVYEIRRNTYVRFPVLWID